MLYLYFADNKRLDEWVAEDRLDLTRVQPPKVEEKKKNPFASAAASPATPKPKQMSPSKPPSPERELVTSNGAMMKKGIIIGRKRKANALEEVHLF